MVTKDWGGYDIEDLGSRNGITVGGERVEKCRLKDRDEVGVGPFRLLFIDPDADLMAALADVPGFKDSRPAPTSEGNSESTDEPPTEESSDPSPPPNLDNELNDPPTENVEPIGEGVDEAAAAVANTTSDPDGANDASDSLEGIEIDPSLLQNDDLQHRGEWLIIGGVLALIAISVLVLIALI